MGNMGVLNNVEYVCVKKWGIWVCLIMVNMYVLNNGEYVCVLNNGEYMCVK